MEGFYLSFYGWITICILVLIILSIVIKMFVSTPESKEGKHILAVMPILLGLFFTFLMPKNFLFVNESVSTFTNMIIPVFCLTISLPLVYKAKKK